MTRRGLILFAHGAREASWASPFEAVAARVRQSRPHAEVRLAFLELMPPDLESAAAELCAAGCTEVQVLPLFLGQGAHLKRDLPRLVDALGAAHPGVRFELHPAVGEAPAVIAAIARTAGALLDGADRAR